jgi:hypothetical protein
MKIMVILENLIEIPQKILKFIENYKNKIYENYKIS